MKTATLQVFRLYTAGRSINSAQALENLHALCRDHLPDNHEIEVLDVLREPDRALTDGILVTPTLLRIAGGPELRIIGNLSQRETILAALALDEPFDR